MEQLNPYQTPVELAEEMPEMDTFTPVAPADYTAYVGRLWAMLTSRTQNATKSAWVVCGLSCGAIGIYGYDADMFRFQLRYHAPVVIQKETAATVAQPKTKTSARLQASPTLTPAPNSKPVVVQKEVAAALSFSLQPAEASELPEPNVRAFVEKWTNTAVNEATTYGIPASVTMAQGIIESRSGCSVLSQPLTFAAFDKNKVLRQGCNNFFGVKCAKGNGCPVGHCANHKDDIAKDFFIKYETPEAAWRGHSEFLKKNGYVALAQALGAGRKDYKIWVVALCRKGYATDPNYGKKLLDIISRYNLSMLDDL